MTLGVALTPTMHESWQLILLWGVVVGLGTGFHRRYLSAYYRGPLVPRPPGRRHGRVDRRAMRPVSWFFCRRWRGSTANAGWRTMCLVLTAIVIGFVPVLLWLMRDRPEDLGLAPYGATQADPPVRRRSATP